MNDSLYNVLILSMALMIALMLIFGFPGLINLL